MINKKTSKYSVQNIFFYYVLLSEFKYNIVQSMYKKYIISNNYCVKNANSFIYVHVTEHTVFLSLFWIAFLVLAFPYKIIKKQ